MSTRREILEQSIAMRKDEIILYDINIANYLFSIEGIKAKRAAKMERDAERSKTGEANDAELDAEAAVLTEYEPKMSDLLTSERRERAKAQLFLDAAQRQIDELPSEE